MNFKKFLFPAAAIFLLIGAYQAWGWAGIFLALGGVVMVLMLHYTRFMTIMTRAGDRPVGYVASAVMMNAKLKANTPLINVIAQTRSLGVAITPEGQQPELFRWTDPGNSFVTCEFLDGRLVKWELYRPPVEDEVPFEATVIDPGSVKSE